MPIYHRLEAKQEIFILPEQFNTTIIFSSTCLLPVKFSVMFNMVCADTTCTLLLLTCLQWKRTPLHYVRDAATAQLLVEHGAKVDAVDDVRM